MSLHRALTVPNLSSATRRINRIARFNPTHMVRWQQTGATGGGGSGAGKLLLYTLTGASITAAGSIAYASYDPGFKNTVNEYIPGFSSVADSVTGQWKSIVGSTQNSKNVELVYKAERKDTHVAPGSSTKIETVTERKPKIDPVKEEQKDANSETTLIYTQPEVTKPLEPAREAAPKASPIIETTPIAIQAGTAETQAEEVATVERLVDEDPPIEPDVSQVETSKPTLYPVESAVAAVREETERVAEKILSEQVKDHQSSQSIGEQWMQDTSKVDAKLQETFEDLKALSSKVAVAQGAVIEAVKAHQQKMFEVLKNTDDGASTMETLAEDIASSEVAIEDRKKELNEATLQLQEKTADVSSILTAAEEVGLKSKAEEIEGDITKLMADLDVGENSLLEAESSSEVLRDYREEARRSREQLQRELGTVPPQANLKQEAIVLMQRKRIDVLQHKLDEIEQEKATSLAAALEKQKQKLDELAVEKLKLKLHRQRLQMDQEYARKEFETARELEAELREKIRLQSEAHASHLRDALSSQAGELGSVWSQELELKLIEQEAQYQIEMSKAMARLRGIESMVNTIANAGELTRHQQIIRNACDTLSGALDQANTNPDDRFTILKEIASLRKAAQGDNFVLSVIESIPKQAASESSAGIQSESGLQERFQKVYRICKRVSLVPESGGGLGTYALSYLQSLLVFNVRGVKETKDIDRLDTFELLSLADSSMQRGDLEKAVWYVSHLRNESGRVAQDWLEDARLYLETRQAVRVIQTYTSATNIAFN